MPKNTFLNLEQKKQERILEAAIKEFLAKGYQKGSIQSIANNADVAKGSMYQYFENKKELFLHIIDLAIQIKIDYMVTLIKENQNLSYFEQIEKMLSTSFHYYSEYPDLYQIYQTIHNGMHEDIRTQINEKVNELGNKYNKELLIKAMENKEVRDDLSIDLASFMVYSLLKNFGTFLINKECIMSNEERGEYVDQFIELLKKGLKTN